MYLPSWYKKKMTTIKKKEWSQLLALYCISFLFWQKAILLIAVWKKNWVSEALSDFLLSHFWCQLNWFIFSTLCHTLSKKPDVKKLSDTCSLPIKAFLLGQPNITFSPLMHQMIAKNCNWLTRFWPFWFMFRRFNQRIDWRKKSRIYLGTKWSM